MRFCKLKTTIEVLRFKELNYGFANRPTLGAWSIQCGKSFDLKSLYNINGLNLLSFAIRISSIGARTKEMRAKLREVLQKLSQM